MEEAVLFIIMVIITLTLISGTLTIDLGEKDGQ